MKPLLTQPKSNLGCFETESLNIFISFRKREVKYLDVRTLEILVML